MQDSDFSDDHQTRGAQRGKRQRIQEDGVRQNRRNEVGWSLSAQRAWADGCRRLEHGSMLVAAIDPPEGARPYSIYGIIEMTERARILAAVELVCGTAELSKPAPVGRDVGM